MAGFKYRMQNILNIKIQLEKQAKIEFAIAQNRLRSEEEKLNVFFKRKEECLLEGIRLRAGSLNFLDIRENELSLERMDDLIENQKLQVKVAEKEVAKALKKMTELMQDRKTHEKLKEKQFEAFKKDLEKKESKEIDELTSYTYSVV